MGDFVPSDSWSARLFDLAAMPWRLSRRVLGQLDADAVLWPDDGLGHPLAPPLEALHAGCVAGARLPGVGTSSRELANKLRAFSLFRWADRQPEDPSTSGDGSELALYDRLWLAEGAGHRLARRHGDDADLLRQTLRADDQGYGVARHSGVGLALAIRELERCGGSVDSLDAFVEAVDAVCAPRYRTAALENFGLAVRTLRPERLPAFGERATELKLEPELAGPYWHGAGRGLYFAPTQLVDPSMGVAGRWEAVSRLTAEVPEAYRPDAVSGLAWALTLVNVRHPEVVARRLRVHSEADGADETESEWLAQGVASSLMMWLGSTGLGTTADRLTEALPSGLGHTVRELLDAEYATVEREGSLAELFRYPGWRRKARGDVRGANHVQAR